MKNTELNTNKIPSQNGGYLHSQEWREKISASMKGHGCSPETRAKMREAHLKVHMDEKWIANMREGQRRRRLREQREKFEKQLLESHKEV